MKKILTFLAINFLLMATALKAQVSVETFPTDPQSGPHNYFGVRVTLAQTYSENVTVTGFIYDEGGGPNTNHPFTLVVIASELTAETAANYYETDPTASAIADFATMVIGYAGVSITYEANACILKFNSAADVNTVIDQLQAEYDAYNEYYESEYSNLTAEELDDMDEENDFDEFQSYKAFEALFGGFCSKRAEIESVENTWIANSFSGTNPDDIDRTFDEAVNTIFNSSYSFKIGNDIYQLTSSGMYKNSVLQDEDNTKIKTKESNLAFAGNLNNPGYSFAGPMSYIPDYNFNDQFTLCKTNKYKTSSPIVSGNHKFIQKVAITYIVVRTSIVGKIVHYKNGHKKRIDLSVGVSGPVYNLSCSSIGSKSNTNPNGSGYKKRRSLKVRDGAAGPVWKTYTNEVGTSFVASGGSYYGTFMLTW